MMTTTRTKGYRNPTERWHDRQERAAKVWQAAYSRALGFDPDPEGVAHRAMRDYLASNGGR